MYQSIHDISNHLKHFTFSLIISCMTLYLTTIISLIWRVFCNLSRQSSTHCSKTLVNFWVHSVWEQTFCGFTVHCLCLHQPPQLAQTQAAVQLCCSTSLRYDVTTTNLWCMIMNTFPVCVSACRAVDCVNLFILIQLCLNYQALFKALSFDVNTNIKSSFLNVAGKSQPFAERGVVSAAHKYMNGWRVIAAGWASASPGGRLKSPSMHPG